MPGNKKTNSATARLKQDYLRIKRDPVPYVTAEPLPSNLLEWHYCVKGPESSVYEGGFYHGKLLFPAEFPFRPPSIYMITPNGRFKANTRLCLSISDFHPDMWNPAWSVSTILTGLLSFMMEKSPTLGSIETSDYEKRHLAYNSLDFNMKDKVFVELFPDIVQTIQAELARRAEKEKASKLESLQHSTDAQTSLQQQLVNNQEQSTLHSVLANVFVIIGFAAFAYTVKYVLKSIAAE
uniref:Ubiquitin-conjugating enzyme E2 J2 n=1 Tax=Xibalbanus tulumensis TaxID=1519145 RepID=A0A481SX50_XIBTU|nr:ubiquitin-conjugating enzyme E2 j2 [Xibalbanus tulumensis]